MSTTETAGLRGALAGLERATDEQARRRVLARNRQLPPATLLEAAAEEVGRLAHVDVARAERLSRAAAWLAGRGGRREGRAFARRAAAHVLFVQGRYRPALASYHAAARVFRSAGNQAELARTLSSALQTQIYLGRYAEALRSAARARRIFERFGQARRLARLDANVGNVFFRQDRFEEAIGLYRTALDRFAEVGEPLDAAVVLSNLATCQVSLGQFEEALRTYERARQHCERHGLTRLRLQADYNIAYLYYLRGQYTRALELYQAVRDECQRLGDAFHRALCDLDQAEIFLELNLGEEAEDLAARAHAGFKGLAMGYEAAKAAAFQAMARAQLGDVGTAWRLFDHARALFVREGNYAWPAWIDVHEAALHLEARDWRRARAKAASAWRFFSGSALGAKAVLCQLLMARLELAQGAARRARRRCRAALRTLESVEAPVLRYQACFVLGQAEEALGDAAGAYRSFQQASARLQNLRSHVQGDGPRIAFLKDKLAVYENLVRLNLSGRRPDVEAAFACIEQAKSRSLAELLAFRAQDLPVPGAAHRAWAVRVRRLRERLNGCYREIERAEGEGPDPAGAAEARRRVAALRRRGAELEAALLHALSDRRGADREFRSIQSGQTVGLEAIQTALPDRTALIEYYEAQGSLYACLVSRAGLEIVSLGPTARIRSPFRLMQFQLAKLRLGGPGARRPDEPLDDATRSHLSELYQALVAPVRERTGASHLVVVPHGFLHYVPFHALIDGDRYLIDEVAVSYAPSASVFYLCTARPPAEAEGSLVLGVPDPRAPHILDEVRTVAACLPRPQVFVGGEATEERLRTEGARCRFIHVATHGHFRQDNPMFSSIRLGDGHLSLFDLYELQLAADLVVLSGCGTGLSVVVGGDELLGLVRGLLYAGARSALLTLWDVSDQSTADFMGRFYREAQNEADWARAVQRAMIALRKSHPHPYYWAPFVLIGRVGARSPMGRQA